MENFEGSSFSHGNNSISLDASVGGNDRSTSMGAVPVTCHDLYLATGSAFPYTCRIVFFFQISGFPRSIIPFTLKKISVLVLLLACDAFCAATDMMVCEKEEDGRAGEEAEDHRRVARGVIVVHS
jgi:hypothetical protein